MWLLALALAAFPGTVSGCAPTTSVGVRGTLVSRRPPLDRVEIIGPMPAPGYVWTRGYWAWSAGEYMWVPGQWVLVSPGYRAWVPGRWIRTTRGWYWRSGYWR